MVDDLATAAAEAEANSEMNKVRRKSIEEMIQSEKSYLRHLEIIREFFMKPVEVK